MRARRTRRILPWSFYTPSVAARWMSGNQVHGPPTAFEFVRSGSCLMYSRWRGAIVAGQRGGPLLRFASCFDVTKSEQRKERKKAWRERERERERRLWPRITGPCASFRKLTVNDLRLAWLVTRARYGRGPPVERSHSLCLSSLEIFPPLALHVARFSENVSAVRAPSEERVEPWMR